MLNKTAKQRLDERQNELQHTAKKSLGQNFLVSDHVISKIIEAAKKCEPKAMIEIGPGLGAITDLLLNFNVPYQAIEMDAGLFDYWSKKNVQIFNEDALKFNWKTIKSDLLVSNLPYQISSSIVIDRSIDPGSIQNMVLMFQKEVAQRIRAAAKTEHYGLLSVIAQEFWDIATVCEAGPRDFLPAPKVASRVLSFKIKETDFKDFESKKKYLNFVKQCFAQRRRILKSNLPASVSDKVLEWIHQNQLTDKVRAEELSPGQIKNLYRYLFA